MYQKILFILTTLFLLTSCSSERNERLTVSATAWIGYSPLFYAKAKGWLEPLNIRILHVASLSENMYLYEAGKSDAYVGTQYEYNLLSHKDPSLVPVMLFDRSNGGDIVMSNMSIKELQNRQDMIDTYLEMDSINSTILEEFIAKYQLDNTIINYINNDQPQISILNIKNIKKPTIIVTYTPYDIALQKHGFKKIASTKDNLNLLVIDALFATEKIFSNHKHQFVALKKLIDNAIGALEKNPEEFYKTVKPYMPELNYNEFRSSLDGIVWINKTLSTELSKRMQDSSFPSRNLI